MNRKEIVERQQAILDAAKREGRELTAEETREFESLQRSLDEMDAGEGQQGQRGQKVEKHQSRWSREHLQQNGRGLRISQPFAVLLVWTRPNTFLPEAAWKKSGRLS